MYQGYKKGRAGLGEPVFMLIFIYGGLRYLGSLFYKEVLILTEERLYIGYKSLFRRSRSVHRIEDIAYMALTGENGKEHIQAYERLYGIDGLKLESDLLNREGRIRFFDRGRAVRFGIGLSPDQASSLISLLEEYSANNLDRSDKDEVLGII